MITSIASLPQFSSSLRKREDGDSGSSEGEFTDEGSDQLRDEIKKKMMNKKNKGRPAMGYPLAPPTTTTTFWEVSKLLARSPKGHGH